jgi:hypothetical protein
MMNNAPQDDLGFVLRRLPGHIFAVLDGAHFNNLPARLREVGLEYFPLYVDETDAPQLNTGPHLVVCRTGYAVEQVRDVAAGAPTVVWWSWPDTGAEPEIEIYRHLRRLNLMDVPWSYGQQSAPRDGALHTYGTAEPVLFRHSDPDVIAALLPVLVPPQKARLFGGANAVVFQPTNCAEVVHVRNPVPNLPVPFGRLRLSTEQFAELNAAYGVSLRRCALVDFGKQLSPGMPRVLRESRIKDAVTRAESYALATREQVWDFIRMDLRYGARFELEKARSGVLVQLRNPDLPAEERLFRAQQEMGFLERHIQPQP